MKLTKSNALLNRALRYIPEGSQTKSKMACRFPEQFPKFIEQGLGSHVWDIDSNEYIDWIMGLGPVTIGYEKIKPSHHGVFSLPSPKEAELAELLCDIIPCAEMARFGKNGGDATMAAVRLARAVTGKRAILYCGYHGAADWFASQIIPSAGTTPQLVYPFEYNNIESITDFFDKAKERFGEDNPVAAIIMEVPPEEPEPDFLQRVINIAHNHGALFILDEIVTGFRYALGGAQELYGITPDLACFGKGMANGFPISCVVGKKEIMQDFDKIFWSTTFGGDIGAIEASILTINTFLEKDVIGHIWKMGSILRTHIALGLPKYATLRGNPARSLIEFKDDPDFVLKSLFLQEVAKRGVLMGVPIFPCFSHDLKDVEQTRFAIEKAFEVVEKNKKDPRKALVGEPLKMTGIRK